MGDEARRGFEDFGVSVGRATGFGFGFDGVEGVEVGLGIEEVTGVLALGRGIESEDITRGRGLSVSMVDDGEVVGGPDTRSKQSFWLSPVARYKQLREPKEACISLNVVTTRNIS